MTAFRVIALTLALGLLAACDDSPKPPAPAKTAPSAEITPPPAATKPAPQSAAVKPPAAEPVKKKEPAEVAPKKAPALTVTPAAKPLVKAKPEPLPPVKLDLRLPDELVQQLEPGEPLDKLPEQPPLLPQLFVEKPTEPGPYQLNGRLITNDKVNDYWESVEGAELQIEFRN
ncbi:hypothetical protein [Pseudomonas sp. Gutcm_11s]|uniref:hypothetical protein n=1 Tax=Pseudomonas sp. Gutcm_11s TaxID=3026088 RepID=UPI00235F6DC8|nr:hypothetical protein [Pseudomonas sp. Gutcm_11s]MDD0842649.1 hypothetical protein [Pseudomonas sp. Gutcm_11s]